MFLYSLFQKSILKDYMIPIWSIQAGHQLSLRVVLFSSCYEGLSPHFRFSLNPDLGKEAQAKHPLPSPLLGWFAILNLFFLSSWEHSLICLLPLPPWPIKGSLVWGWGLGGVMGVDQGVAAQGHSPPTWHQSQAVLRKYLPPTWCTSTFFFLVYLKTLSLAARK